MTDRNEARIDLEAIYKNIENIMEATDSTAMPLAVVKADAYGHGALRVSSYLQDKGIKNFAVASAEEGVELRNGGIKGMILVLGKTPPENADKLASYNLSQACDSYEYAEKLSELYNIKIHIKVDTGMSRLGFYCHNTFDVDNCAKAISSLYTLENITVDGIFTHFADADFDSFTDKQYTVFKQLTDTLMSSGKDIGIRHCCNSAAAIKFPYMHMDMIRLGIALYGLERSLPLFPMNIAMSVYARLSSVSVLNVGDTVSYGRTYTLEERKTVGVVSFGYADGMPRLLSNRYSVTINGKKAPILGRICMDMFMIDISGIECAEGDEVCIFGKAGEVSEMADIIGTINYELVCGISKRVRRVY